MSLTVISSIVFLTVVLVVLPTVVVLRDLRRGRPDPSWNGDR
jgi:hypothetical protein